MFYTIHNANSGALLNITTSLPDAQPSELVIKGWDAEIPDLYYYKWDSSQLAFVPKSNIEHCITVHQFMNRFSAAERIAIKEVAKINSSLSDYMDMLYQSSFVDIGSQEVYGGLYYLSLLGLITPERILEIIS